MRMAGRFSRRLRAWAQAKNIPVIYCSPGEDKPKIAEQPLASHEVKSGLFLVLVCKAPALVWEVQPTGTGKLGQLVPKQPWPYVNHYSFHMRVPLVPLEVERRFSDPVRLESGWGKSQVKENRRGENVSHRGEK